MIFYFFNVFLIDYDTKKLIKFYSRMNFACALEAYYEKFVRTNALSNMCAIAIVIFYVNFYEGGGLPSLLPSLTQSYQKNLFDKYFE